jgi:outer membrane protein OmpA-like peptidoglycan-associated protein
VAGATMISLSRRQLEELKGASGQTWFRYFQLVDVDERSLPGNDRYGQIRRVSVGTRTLNVNDEQKSLPALNVEGMLYKRGGDDPVTLKLTVLDDARFPLVLDFEFPQWGFAIHRSKVTYPSTGRLEQQLAAEKRVDVYGIYFDTASATLRPESEPVLVEIAGVLRQHKDWRLRIDGHTDSIGTPESNLELSQRRAESVKAALIARHGLTSDRFTTGGHGARVPKDTNDTPDGRARNRRVELVRQ